MKWDHFYSDIKDWLVIESQYLYLLYKDKKEVELQLSRWQKQKKLHRLKKGYYILDDRYRKTEIFEPYIAGIWNLPLISVSKKPWKCTTSSPMLFLLLRPRLSPDAYE